MEQVCAVEESPERKTTSSTPISKEEKKTTGSTPISKEEKKTTGSTPISKEEKKTTGSTPISKEEKKTTSSTTNRKKGRKTTSSTPISKEEKKTTGSTPISEEEKKTTGSTPNRKEEKKTTGSTPNRKEEKKTTGSTPNRKEEKKTTGSTPNRKEEKKTTGSTPNRKEEEEGNPPGSSDDTVKTKEEEDTKLSVICWNVDGLDGEEQPQRARALCSYLILNSPDVVLLQELIQPYISFLKQRLETNYTFIEGGKQGYFTGMMLKKSRITLLDTKIDRFRLSQMGRNLLVAQVLFRGQKLCLMTSHFESCRAHAAERMRQLRMVMNRMKEVPDDVTVLFGGDTNLRDVEVATMGLPDCVRDVWEQLGEPEHCRYTWDTYVNTNLDMEFKNRLRFDRLYLRQATKDGVPQLAPDSMALTGLEKLKCDRYISDHWGIHCTFSTQ